MIRVIVLSVVLALVIMSNAVKAKEGATLVFGMRKWSSTGIEGHVHEHVAKKDRTKKSPRTKKSSKVSGG